MRQSAHGCGTRWQLAKVNVTLLIISRTSRRRGVDIYAVVDRSIAASARLSEVYQYVLQHPAAILLSIRCSKYGMEVLESSSVINYYGWPITYTMSYACHCIPPWAACRNARAPEAAPHLAIICKSFSFS